ncbi:hypothetical protein SAMN05444004_11431 [Jannaschia faecimaris]|uniref:Uncharacterized protein n=1 Tax=Jannaschia faecimaris TaxID=1244108 RepID=A0A1H3SXI1_9RHOB|nr:hypothetical protein SAMN05444004_11431 [Jannaschia faecimaris]
MMRAFFVASCAMLPGCNALGSSGAGSPDAEVRPGLASCLVSIGRPDVVADPGAAMSNTEIAALLDCTAERASR